MRKINIAIDGFSSCGKSTLAKDLAKKLNYVFVDTGAMYRAITYYFLQLKSQEIVNEYHEIIPHLNEINLDFQINQTTLTPEIHCNGQNISIEIREKEVNQNVSHIAAIKEVREKLVAEQQKMGLNGGVVMDGRDIGTVVFPNAELKLFITADPNVRTQRRFDELKAAGKELSFDAVKENLLERDYIDTTRKESPLIKATDAIEIDNSNLNKEEQLNLVLKLVEDRINQ